MSEIEKAIKYAKSCQIANEKEEPQYNPAKQFLRITLEALQEKQEREKGWIPVSRRLPNKEECEKYDRRHPRYHNFLCTVKFNNGFDNFYQTRELYFSGIFGWKYGAEDYNEFVIAWQPLPEPYKEGENDG